MVPTVFLFNSSKSKVFSQTQGKLLAGNPYEITIKIATTTTTTKLHKTAQNKDFYFRKDQFMTETQEKRYQVL